MCVCMSVSRFQRSSCLMMMRRVCVCCKVKEDRHERWSDWRDIERAFLHVTLHHAKMSECVSEGTSKERCNDALKSFPRFFNCTHSGSTQSLVHRHTHTHTCTHSICLQMFACVSACTTAASTTPTGTVCLWLLLLLLLDQGWKGREGARVRRQQFLCSH